MKLFRTLRLTAVTAGLLAAVGTPAAFASPGVSVTASPNPVVAAGTVTYTMDAPYALPGDTVSLQDTGWAIAGCQAVPVNAGVATCTAPASSQPGTRTIYPELNREGSPPSGGVSTQLVVLTPTTTTVSAAPKLTDPGATMTYVATVSPRPVFGDASVQGDGPPDETVDFSVDGVAIAACADRAVDTDTGVAICTAAAPIAGGGHVATGAYSGWVDARLAPSSGQDDFAVKAPAATFSAGALDFGSVTVGANGSRSVTLTNSGTAALHVGAATAGGSFAITSNGCAGATLAPGASCVITLAFTPSAAGGSAATLTVASDGGSPTVALIGTGAAVPTVITEAPTGAKFAPHESTTLSVTKSDSGASSVTVPVRCPTGVACTLDGTVVIATSDLAKAAAHSSATKVQTVARFSGVRVAAGKVKEIKLKLSPAFIKSAQRRGIRLIRATLTIHTTFTDGTKATSKQRVKIRIPRAAVKQAVKPSFTG